MDIDDRLKKLEESIDEHNIDLYDPDFLSIPIRLASFKLNGYSNLVVELNKERYDCETYIEKASYIDRYKKVYLSNRGKYKCLLQNLSNGTLKICYPECLSGEEDYLYGALDHSWDFEKDKSLDENITAYMKAKLKLRIHEIDEELYILSHYPSSYVNTFSTFIGPNSVAKYESDMICYKDVSITVYENHHFAVSYNENSTEETKNALFNILSFFNGEPYFYFTENYNFNRKICELYEQFDLLDMLRLRTKNFFDSKRKEPFYLELPILRNKNRYNLICFEDLQHEMVFELYHASLKQF
jgi:hypothetical protein